MAFAYILRCSDGTYYVGSTHNLQLRVWQHDNGQDGASYTRRRRPVTLVWSAEFEHIGAAFAVEKQIQGWSRAKREALIRGDFDALPDLASRPTARRDVGGALTVVVSRLVAGAPRTSTTESGADGGGFEARRWRSSHLNQRERR